MLERGQNWLITDGQNVQLFDTIGVRGRFIWTLDGREIRPQHRSEQIIELVRGVVGQIRGMDIAAIKVSPQVGVLLYLEGVVSLQHLQRAQETRNTITCTNVVIGGVSRRLVIERGLDPWRPAVVDDDDNVIS